MSDSSELGAETRKDTSFVQLQKPSPKPIQQVLLWPWNKCVPEREEAAASRVTNGRTAHSWPPLTAGLWAEGNTYSNQCQACSPHTYIVDQVDAPPPRRGHWFYYPRSSVLWIRICSKYWEIEKRKKQTNKQRKEGTWVCYLKLQQSLRNLKNPTSPAGEQQLKSPVFKLALKREMKQEEAKEEGGRGGGG